MHYSYLYTSLPRGEIGLLISVLIKSCNVGKVIVPGSKGMTAKKEDKRKHKEEKQEEAKRKQHVSSLLTKIGLVLAVPLILYVLFVGLINRGQTLSPAVVGSADHLRGNVEAALTITVYSDFQCPACQIEAQVFSRAWPQISDKVRLVFRHYPLDTHRHAFLAALYAEAAGRQNKFWEIHDVLYGNQPLWTNVEDPTELFDGYAQQLGLDIVMLKQAIEDPSIRAKILADQRGGNQAGVRSTPSLYFNGRPVSNPQSASALIALVSKVLAEG